MHLIVSLRFCFYYCTANKYTHICLLNNLFISFKITYLKLTLCLELFTKAMT